MLRVALSDVDLSDDAVPAIGFVSQEDLLVVSRSAAGLTFASPISLETSATFTIGTDRITAARFNRTTTSLQLVSSKAALTFGTGRLPE